MLSETSVLYKLVTAVWEHLIALLHSPRVGFLLFQGYQSLLPSRAGAICIWLSMKGSVSFGATEARYAALHLFSRVASAPSPGGPSGGRECYHERGKEDLQYSGTSLGPLCFRCPKANGIYATALTFLALPSSRKL